MFGAPERKGYDSGYRKQQQFSPPPYANHSFEYSSDPFPPIMMSEQQQFKYPYNDNNYSNNASMEYQQQNYTFQEHYHPYPYPQQQQQHYYQQKLQQQQQQYQQYQERPKQLPPASYPYPQPPPSQLARQQLQLQRLQMQQLEEHQQLLQQQQQQQQFNGPFSRTSPFSLRTTILQKQKLQQQQQQQQVQTANFDAQNLRPERPLPPAYTSPAEVVTIFFNGAVKHDTVIGGCAFAIFDSRNKIVAKSSLPINQLFPSQIHCDLHGLVFGLKTAISKQYRRVVVKGTSKFVMQVLETKCRHRFSPYLQTFYAGSEEVLETLKHLIPQFDSLNFELISGFKKTKRMATRIIVNCTREQLNFSMDTQLDGNDDDDDDNDNYNNNKNNNRGFDKEGI